MKRIFKGSIVFGLIASYYNLLFVGIATIVRGYLLPQIKDEFGISYTSTGFMFLLPLIPGFIGSLFSGYILNKFNKKLIVIIACIINTIFYFFLPFSRSYLQFLIFSFIISFGAFTIAIASNTTVSDFFTEKYPRFRDNGINLLHFLYAFGAVIALIISNIIFKKNNDWRFIYFLIGIASVIIFIIFLFADLKSNRKNNKEYSININSFFNILFNKKMILFSIALLFYAGAELSLIYWLPTYFEDGYGLTKSYSAVILILFFVFFAIGRFCGSLIIHKINQLKLLFFLIIFAALSLIIGFVFKVSFFTFNVFIPLSGFFLSIIFPTVQNFIIKEFPDDINIATGILYASTTIGCTLLPFLIGVFNDIIGVKYGIFLTVIFTILIIPYIVTAAENRKFIFAFNKK